LLSILFLTFYYVLTLALYTMMRALLDFVLGVYLAIIGGIVVFALGNRPEKRTAAFYSFSYVFMGLVMLTVSTISIYGLIATVDVTDPRDDLASCHVSDFELTGGVVTALGLIFLSAFLHGEFSVLLSTLQYYFMLPTFVVRWQLKDCM
jgi:chitin synthase